MRKNYFSLEVNKSNKLTKGFQLILGITCILLIIGWTITNYDILSSGFTFWMAILFLLGFGYYQINAGLGMGEKFIEIMDDRIRFKEYSVVPPKIIQASELQKAEIFSLSITFNMRSGKKIRFRFGTTFTDSIDPVKDAIENFCSSNGIETEHVTEVI